MKQTTTLKISGIISFVCALFHLAFPLMPNWNFALETMPDDYGAIFITYHYILIAFFVGMGYISVFQSKKLINSSIKQSVLVLFSSLYIIRIFTEFVCWGISFPQAAIVLPMCLLPIIGYFSVVKPNQKLALTR